MELFLLFFGALIFKGHEGTVTYKECQAINFEMKACKNAKDMYDTGKALCAVQGKGFSGESSCK